MSDLMYRDKFRGGLRVALVPPKLQEKKIKVKKKKKDIFCQLVPSQKKSWPVVSPQIET
jgi:hypothetical protein